MTTPTPPRRRSFRFSLRTLFLVSVVLGLLLYPASRLYLNWRSEQESSPENDAAFQRELRDPQAWWKLSGKQLETFVQGQIATADHIKIISVDNDGSLGDPVFVRDKAVLKTLSNAFAILSPPRSPGIWDAGRYTYFEIVGTRTMRFSLIARDLTYGPTGGDSLESSISDSRYWNWTRAVDRPVDFRELLEGEFDRGQLSRLNSRTKRP